MESSLLVTGAVGLLALGTLTFLIAGLCALLTATEGWLWNRERARAHARHADRHDPFRSFR